MNLTLENILEDRIEAEKSYLDYVSDVSLKTCSMDNDGIYINDIPLTPYACKQLLRWLNINVAMFYSLSKLLQRQILIERLGGYIENFNKYEGFDRELLLRQDGNVIRGVLSKGYRIINHSEVLSETVKAINSHKLDVTIDKSLSSNGHLNVRAMTDIIETGDYGLGFTVGNGELGNTCLYVTPYIFRKVCSNGLIVPIHQGAKSFRLVHRGISGKDYSLREAIYDAIISSKEGFNTFMSTKDFKVAEPELELKRVAKRIGLPKKQFESLVMAYNMEPMKTGFGIINAVTRMAQNYTNVDKRMEYEKSASSLFKLYSN